jgi:hypothetical protein
MKRSIWILIMSGLVLISCARFTVVKPIYPEIGQNNVFPSTVDGLQPTFRWEPSPAAETYDFIIYKAINFDKGIWIWKGIRRAVGREIYYREGLKESEHKIEEPLAPNTEYYWSVRIRKGQEVSSWSLYYLSIHFDPFGQMETRRKYGEYFPFLFDTPKKSK